MTLVVASHSFSVSGYVLEQIVKFCVCILIHVSVDVLRSCGISLMDQHILGFLFSAFQNQENSHLPFLFSVIQVLVYAL